MVQVVGVGYHTIFSKSEIVHLLVRPIVKSVDMMVQVVGWDIIRSSPNLK